SSSALVIELRPLLARAGARARWSSEARSIASSASSLRGYLGRQCGAGEPSNLSTPMFQCEAALCNAVRMFDGRASVDHVLAGFPCKIFVPLDGIPASVSSTLRLGR